MRQRGWLLALLATASAGCTGSSTPATPVATPAPVTSPTAAAASPPPAPAAPAAATRSGPDATPGSASPATDPAASPTSLPPALGEAMPQEVVYDSKGRRDPFESLEVRQGSGPTVASARLTGIVHGTRGPLALIETAEGLGYILKPGDTLGTARLVEIGLDSVVFRLEVQPGFTTDRVVLKLPGD